MYSSEIVNNVLSYCNGSLPYEVPQLTIPTFNYKDLNLTKVERGIIDVSAQLTTPLGFPKVTDFAERTGNSINMTWRNIHTLTEAGILLDTKEFHGYCLNNYLEILSACDSFTKTVEKTRDIRASQKIKDMLSFCVINQLPLMKPRSFVSSLGIAPSHAFQYYKQFKESII